MYRDRDACIVGYGCVFPGGTTAPQFINAIFKGEHFISDLLEVDRAHYPFSTEAYYNRDRQAEDQTYSRLGAYIDRVALAGCAKINDMDLERFTSVDVVAVEAFRQAFAPVKHLPDIANAEIVLGYANASFESLFFDYHAVWNEVESMLRAEGLSPREITEALGPWRRDYETIANSGRETRDSNTAELLKLIKNKFGLTGAGCFVDAACASSLAAMHLALKKLRQGEADLIFSGGADMVLNPMTLTCFSKAGATSAELICPFDERARGVNIGEGAGIFALMRLGDARARNLKVHAVVRACEGSSDGRTSAIVEPTIPGQLRAYAKTYQAAAVDEVDFIEAHGTGTVVGDRVEIASLGEFFGNKKIHLGTVKALIGHACSAAGAAGMIKSLGICERRALPPSPHFKKFPKGIKTSLKVNNEVVELTPREAPITVGISSLGFGGINFHLVMQEYKSDLEIKPTLLAEETGVVVCGSRFFDMEKFGELQARTKFKIPPKSQSRIDKLQLMGIMTTEQTLKELGIQPQLLDRARVHTISSSMIATDMALGTLKRVTFAMLKRNIPAGFSPAIQVKLSEFIGRRMADLPSINEDTLAGFCSNVIAGRVANLFNFTGVNFNIDSGSAGFAAGLSAARSLLAHERAMAVLVSAEEEIVKGLPQPHRTGMRCTILANVGYCLEHDLPVQSVLKKVYHEAAARA